MRLPRVRFTVRRMMVTVAVLALALGGMRWGLHLSSLSQTYLEKARDYGSSEKAELTTMEIAREIASVPGPSPSEPVKFADHYAQLADQSERRARHLAALREKYMMLARSPWLPVAPDPPWPE